MSGQEPHSLLRTARFTLGGLLILLVLLAIWTSTFWPSAPTSFSYFMVATGLLAGGWFILAFLVKRKLGKFGVRASLPRTIVMVFRRQAGFAEVEWE